MGNFIVSKGGVLMRRIKMMTGVLAAGLIFYLAVAICLFLGLKDLFFYKNRRGGPTDNIIFNERWW